MKIISSLFLILIILASAYFLIGLGTIIKNGTSIYNKPGSITRLKLFFSTNIAKTDETSSFSELKPRRYTLQKTDMKTLSAKVVIAAESLGYKFMEESSKDGVLHFTITTAVFKFVDDLTIYIEKKDTENNNLTSTELIVNATSQSRLGRADFGANIANISRFFTTLDLATNQN